ncbi:MAG: hypothetical protein ABIL01_05165 [Pseudomonadota bacterium]
MFALRTPEWSQRRGPAGRAVRTAVSLLARAVLVVAALMLFTFVTVNASQACSGGTNPTTRVAQIAQAAPQVIAKQYVIANRSALASSVIKFAVKGIGCCGKGSGHCHGLACAGSCCPACSAGLNVAGWTVAPSRILYGDIPPAQNPRSSTEPDAQFRPPRIIL